MKDIPTNENLFKETTTQVRNSNSCHKKTEPVFQDEADSANTATTWSFKDTRNELVSDPKKDRTNARRNMFLDMETADWDIKNNWDNIRIIQSSVPPVTSSSSCSSPDFQQCPSSPRDFDTVIQPEDIKREITLNLQNLLSDDAEVTSMVAAEKSDKKPELLRSILEKSPLNDCRKRLLEKAKSSDNDHKLIRQILKDTTFQKKYNLQPVDIQGLGTGFQAEVKVEEKKCDSTTTAEITDCSSSTHALKEDVCDVNLTEGIIAPMLSKAIEQLMQDVDNTSMMLGIPRGKVPMFSF